MIVLWQKLQNWWKEATPKKRFTSGILVFGVICTILFFIFSSSYQYHSIDSTTYINEIDSPLYYVGVVAKTLGVLLLIVGGAIILKRMQKKQTRIHAERAMDLMESIRLSPKQVLHIVRVGEKYFLVGATDQNVNLLSQVDPYQQKDVEEHPAPINQQSFEAYLADVTQFENQAAANHT
ncbi:MAG: flagellar biosynthetic protein FliO [Anaerolineaceae bacterium]